MAKFNEAKELFRDVVNLDFYIPLSSSEKTKNDLINAIEQKEKMILLTGEAGSGKSLILKKIYAELKNKKKIFYVANPYLEINSLLNLLKKIELNVHQILLLDEAQLLNSETWENLRIYADRGNVTIVFATHDTNVKKLLEKKHFSTRINYIIPIKKVTKKDVEKFIITKLLKNNMNEIADMFSDKNFKKIYKYSKGSLRAVNQLMFKLFDILDYFDKKYPGKIKDKIENKYIEIAIMDLKEFNA